MTPAPQERMTDAARTALAEHLQQAAEVIERAVSEAQSGPAAAPGMPESAASASAEGGVVYATAQTLRTLDDKNYA